MNFLAFFLVLLCEFSGHSSTQRLTMDGHVVNVINNTLDLSNTGLTRVPSELFVNLTKLTSLSLARNNITTIERHVFKTLVGLQILNLSHTNLTEWKGAIYHDLPSLRVIDLTGNLRWRVGKRLLNVTSLQEIRGVTWSDVCTDCLLTKSPDDVGALPPLEELTCNEPMIFKMQHGFDAECTGIPDACSPECYEIPKKPVKKMRNFYAGYAVGSIGILVNVIVFVTVLFCRVLRRDLTMALITNMAVCDIMIGIFTILMSHLNVFNESAQSGEHIYFPKAYCQSATVLLTVGEIVSTVTSLLLTVEKYTCIVYCMSPDVRLKRKYAAAILLTTWIASLLFALSPLYGFIDLKYSPSFMCSMPVNEGKKPTFVIYPLAIITLNYVLMIPMYIHIFLVVKKSSNEMGLQRNAALAKKVLILIGSNFVFFAIPMVLFTVNVFRAEGHHETNMDMSLTDFIVYTWLPVMFLGINSVLNPFLCAFRHRKFQQQFVGYMCFRGRLTEQLRQALSRLTLSRMSRTSTGSKAEIYEVESEANALALDQRRPRLSSQIPSAEENAVVLRIIQNPQNEI